MANGACFGQSNARQLNKRVNDRFGENRDESR